MNYMEVAIAKQRGGTRLYTYQSDNLLNVGDIVSVPFGKKNVTGVVYGVVKKPAFVTKPIKQKLQFTLPDTSLKLLTWMMQFYADDYGALTQLLLPASFTVKPSKKPLTINGGEQQKLPNASGEQAKALTAINESERILLHGDTGTGKTRVFLEVAKNCLKAGKSVVIVTPEIGLTPQLVKDIGQHIPAPMVLTHSAMTDAERRKAWEYTILNEQPTVYIGPRSVLFLPMKNLGLIVLDEAHDGAYKQGQSPRYQAGHIAATLAGLHKAKLILSTATPNIADYEQAKQRGYSVARLSKLAAGEHRSIVSLVDITDRSLFNRSQYLSDELVNRLDETLKKGEQSIVFLNRRGSARLVQCAACGWQALCPNCGIPLTYHHDLHTIRCHTCSYKTKAPSSCPTCGSVDLEFKSIGTKTLVEHIQKLLSQARIMRFDTDNSAAEQLYKHIQNIKAGDVDILVGTQLITKGIDLPNLGLVGVVNADTGLNLPDFRAEEQTFQQLYQVVGRVDRGHRSGYAVIQTRVPEHPIMQAALTRNWDAFAEYELTKRKQYKYPPFSYIAQFEITKKTSALAEAEANKAIEILQKAKLGVQLLGPSPSFYEQSASGMTWHIIAKGPKRSNLVAAARLLSGDWRCDIDPLNLL